MLEAVETKYKNQFELNNAIEALVKEKDLLNQKFSAEEKEFIRRYSGSGGQGSKGAKGEGVLYEFYTPDYISELMYELAYRHGYDGGNILEPSCATGALIRPAKDYSKVAGFEINPVSKRISEILYPGATIYKGYFETAFLDPPRFTTKLRGKLTWVEQYPFSMVIGNPPYGLYKNQYSSYFDKKLFRQIEVFFIYQGLQMLKPGGLLVYLISSNFMRNGDAYNFAKDEIGKIAELVDAYRLPSVFQFSEVPTDIIVLRKKGNTSFGIPFKVGDEELEFEFIPKARKEVTGKTTNKKYLIPIIKKWIFENLRNRSFPNREMQFEIIINDNAIGKWFSGKYGDKKLKAYTALPEIIKVARYLRSEPGQGKGIRKYYYFASVVSVAGHVYPFLFSVKETKEEKFYYDNRFIPIKKRVSKIPS